MKARVLATILVVSALTAGHAEAVETATDDSVSDPEPWIADYEGTEIDLRDGWDGARACITDGVTSECFDSEGEMLLALAAEGLSASPTEGAPAGTSAYRRQYSCSSYLRLYTGTNYGGSVLAIATQYTFLNLSSYGFNNVTSSYKVGACSSAFYDLNSGLPPQYGGNTGAYNWAPSMLAGWDNRVSSIYIG